MLVNHLRLASTHTGTQSQAIEHLKAFEKKDQHLKAMAATNLAFIYFLEGRCCRPLANERFMAPIDYVPGPERV